MKRILTTTTAVSMALSTLPTSYAGAQQAVSTPAGNAICLTDAAQACPAGETCFTPSDGTCDSAASLAEATSALAGATTEAPPPPVAEASPENAVPTEADAAVQQQADDAQKAADDAAKTEPPAADALPDEAKVKADAAIAAQTDSAPAPADQPEAAAEPAPAAPAPPSAVGTPEATPTPEVAQPEVTPAPEAAQSEAAPAPEAAPSTEAAQPKAAPAAEATQPEAAQSKAAPAPEAAPSPETAQPTAAPAPEAKQPEAAKSEAAPAPEAPQAPEAAQSEQAPAPVAGQTDAPDAAQPQAPAAAPEAAATAPAAQPDAPAEAASPVEAPVVPQEAEAALQSLLGQPAAEEAPAAAAAAEPAPAAAGDAPAAPAAAPDAVATTSTEITAANTRTSGQEFAAAPTAVGNGKKSGLSDFEKFGLVALGALAVGAVLQNGNQVVSNTGDRVVVKEDNGDYRVLKDDDALLRRPGAKLNTETYKDGSTRTVLDRQDGSSIVTIRDASGRVLRRVRYAEDGTETRLIDDLRKSPRVDVATIPKPTYDTTISASDSGTELKAALDRIKARKTARTYSLSQIRDYRQVRALAPTINVDSITFASGSAAIAPTEAEKLAQLGGSLTKVIADRPYEVFLIEGHTDAVGSAASNLALSDRRAESVALALTEYFDVPPENLVVQGYGEGELKVPTQSDEPKNRRVAVRLISPLMQTATMR